MADYMRDVGMNLTPMEDLTPTKRGRTRNRRRPSSNPPSSRGGSVGSGGTGSASGGTAPHHLRSASSSSGRGNSGASVNSANSGADTSLTPSIATSTTTTKTGHTSCTGRHRGGESRSWSEDMTRRAYSSGPPSVTASAKTAKARGGGVSPSSAPHPHLISTNAKSDSSTRSLPHSFHHGAAPRSGSHKMDKGPGNPYEYVGAPPSPGSGQRNNDDTDDDEYEYEDYNADGNNGNPNRQPRASGVYALSGPLGTRGADSRALTDAHIENLISHGFSTGLARALSENATAFDHRIWVVDNSGSMQIGDGHRITGSGKDDIKMVPSTRWEEIQDTVEYHAQMAGVLDSPTIFRLLNDPGSRVGPQQFSVAERGEDQIPEDIQVATETMRKARPGGVTPLTRHIWDIQQSVRSMAPQLQRDGKKVVVVLATDGLPTDEQGYGGDYITEEFIQALRALEGLPIWLVVRLCTDEEPVTKFYNNLDGQLELSLEVLDDFLSEAQEVYRHNKWLNYALPLHHCRELGYHDRLFDLIDERPLTRGEVRDFCCLLFGVSNVDAVPDPGGDWGGFLRCIQGLVKGEQQHWNPIKKKMMPWINLKALNKAYGDGTPCSVM